MPTQSPDGAGIARNSRLIGLRRSVQLISREGAGDNVFAIKCSRLQVREAT